MSLEESIQLLTKEIQNLITLLKLKNEIIKNKNETIQNKNEVTTINKILNEEDAAKYIGMSRSFLRQDRMNGHRNNRTKGPNPIKIGRSIRYDIHELDAWLKENKKYR